MWLRDRSHNIYKKISCFSNKTPKDTLFITELFNCVHHEMTNNMADLFVRRTGKLYFDIDSIYKYESIILEDCIQYLDWNEIRAQQEKDRLHLLVQDATTFYEDELQ